jgi:uncharacterized phage protein gp47/JayE
MTLFTKNFDQMVDAQQASLQVANPLFTFSAGSDVQAFAEANAGIALFLQYLIFKTLTQTRLATSFGADVDSFGADFLFARYPAISATGQILITRFTAPNEIRIPINAVVKTSDNAVSFAIIPDSNNATYNAGFQSYVMNPGVFQVSALVKAIVPGTIGNVAANTVTKLSASLAIGSLTNLAPFVNGVDQESDAAYKNRFQFYINTRSASTRLAIENAIINTQTGLTYTINENVDAEFKPLPGQVTIYVDDGTGFPPDILFAGTVATPGLWQNINNVRPAAVSFTVEPAHPVPVNIEVSTIFNPGYNRNDFVGLIGTAIANYINSLAVGQTLYMTRLYQVIYDSVPGALADAHDLLINGDSVDVTVTPAEVLRFISNAPPGSDIPPSEMTID